MTIIQNKLFLYITKYLKEKGYPPTLSEMGNYMGVKALSTIHQHLEALKNKGYIYCDKKGSPRSYYPDSNLPVNLNSILNYKKKQYFEHWNYGFGSRKTNYGQTSISSQGKTLCEKNME